jgi:hypothetical protein
MNQIDYWAGMFLRFLERLLAGRAEHCWLISRLGSTGGQAAGWTAEPSGQAKKKYSARFSPPTSLTSFCFTTPPYFFSLQILSTFNCTIPLTLCSLPQLQLQNFSLASPSPRSQYVRDYPPHHQGYVNTSHFLWH